MALSLVCCSLVAGTMLWVDVTLLFSLADLTHLCIAECAVRRILQHAADLRHVQPVPGDGRSAVEFGWIPAQLQRVLGPVMIAGSVSKTIALLARHWAG